MRPGCRSDPERLGISWAGVSDGFQGGAGRAEHTFRSRPAERRGDGRAGILPGEIIQSAVILGCTTRNRSIPACCAR